MRVLFVTSEVAPLIKTGGLADVSAALPAALRDLSVDVRTLVPGYSQILEGLQDVQVAAPLSTLSHFPPARLLLATLPTGVPLWVIDCPELYQRAGKPYQDDKGRDWPDNAQRFGLLSRVAALLGSDESPLDWKPDVVHCNDWQAGLAPAYMHFSKGAAPSLMTVHNLAFQGIFPAPTAVSLGLPAESFHLEGVEFYGQLSFMKAGLVYADHITTVSPTYAREIQTAALGFGLQGLLSARRSVLTGILNGVDNEEWNPATDPYLAKTYDAPDIRNKGANKLALQKRMGLHTDAEIPLFGLVGRFAEQKGLDLVLQIAPQLIALPAQLVMLGSGDELIQLAALTLAQRYAGQIAVHVGFDEAIAHQIEAGADIFLMPSRFEPCGLNQLYSQRYGTPPIVHATGGLIDTVVDCNDSTLAHGTASGFVFDQMDTLNLLATARRAIDAYRDKTYWRALQQNCMTKEFGWRESAAAYHAIYSRLMRR